MSAKFVKDVIYKGYRVLVKKFEYKPNIELPLERWYCGYVEIPEENAFYDVRDFNELNCELKAYDDITYANELPETGNFALGFRCDCFGCLNEIQIAEFTLKECFNLVDQIIIKEKSGALSEDEELKLLKKKDDRERMEKLPFWQQIIEDLTGYKISKLFYDNEYELIEVIWQDKYRERLVINVHMDSLRACTHDVIRQTYKWIERN